MCELESEKKEKRVSVSKEVNERVRKRKISHKLKKTANLSGPLEY